MSLKITKVTLPDRQGNWHVAIANGYITQISAAPILKATDETLDA
jgi:cytosine deaminase